MKESAAGQRAPPNRSSPDHSPLPGHHPCLDEQREPSFGRPCEWLVKEEIVSQCRIVGGPIISSSSASSRYALLELGFRGARGDPEGVVELGLSGVGERDRG